MTQLLSASDERGIIQHHKALKPGDRVEITKGSLTGIIGTIDQIAPKKRAWVLIDIMGKETRVSLKQENL